MLATKTDDEQKALQLCQTKVRAKKLPMEVIDAEYQWFVLLSISLLPYELTSCDFVM
jgi:cell fate regulator YaaT (PSP1 superfamily)